MNHRSLRRFTVLLLLILIAVQILRPSAAKAGVFNASDEVTYKEYWVPHSQFTGGCGTNEEPDGSWYLEPYGCDKTVTVQIDDDFSQALRAEIYLDLWRNHDSRVARFMINSGELVWPDVGSDWSRTPYVGDILLADLQVGANTILFYEGGYHVHDIAIRIYYDDTHPLIAGAGSDVTPPDGALLTIQGDGPAIAAAAGGTLQVDNDQLTLTATVSNGAKYVEFHGYYFGMDEDTDGQFRDWHNRGRNNYFPGGVNEQATGGVIDHGGTSATPNDGEYSAIWDISTIPDQDGVRFKIRIVDDAGNVREAAGGVSSQFTLSRNQATIAYWNASFDDYGLYMEGTRPSSVATRFRMPPNFAASDYLSAKMMHSYWNGAIANLNGSASTILPSFIADDHWQMSVADFDPDLLWPGLNLIRYEYDIPAADRPGAFVEKPGPLFILERAPWVEDESLPSLYNPIPMPGQVDVGAGTSIQAQLVDDQSGLDYSTILMEIQGELVSPFIEGAKHTAFVSYRPPISFEPNEVVEVTVAACDLAGNCLEETYSFNVNGQILPTGIVSDDFNGCTLDEAVWEFRDPVGDVDYNVSGAAIEIMVPAGSNHDLWQGVNTAPRIMQPAEDVDFRISARFNSAVNTETQMQGFIIAEDDDNFLRFSMRYGGGTDGEGVYLEGYIFEQGVPINMINLKLDESKPYVVPTDLGVQRIGSLWRFLYVNENRQWEEVGRFEYIPNFPFSFNVTEVGLFAGIIGVPESAAPAFTSSIDFFFDDADPIDPQDQDPLYLPVEIVGAGTVEKTPPCGNPVTLTAVPTNGYFFQGWSSASGNISGASNPLITSFTVGEIVTATFTVPSITFGSGWNMVSSNIEAANPDMWDVFNPIIEDVILVKNGTGEVFWPDQGINNIGNWDVEDGYQVAINAPAALAVRGTTVDPTTPIVLAAGWSLSAFLRETPMPVEIALASVSDQLKLAKDGFGNVYWPEYGVNQIGDMEQGKGYQVCLSTPGTLIYPVED